MAGYGWSLSPDEVQRFYLPYRPDGSTEPLPSSKRSCILLIEDNPADAGLVREALEEYAVCCEVIFIQNGERAIEFIQHLDAEPTDCPDLIILDLNLPRRPGTVVLEQIRASAQCGHTPVIILTSSDDRKDRSDAARLGASLYLRKPSRLDEFIRLGSVFKDMLNLSSM